LNAALVPHCVPLPVLNVVCGPVSSALNGVVGVLFQGVLSAVTKTAAFVLHGLGSALQATTAVNLEAAWFSGNYRAIVAVAALASLFALVLASLDSALRLDPSLLLRAVFFHLPIAGLSVIVAIKVAALAMAGVDGLIGTLERSSGHPAINLVNSLSRLAVESSVSAPGLFSVVIGLMVILGALAVWFELLLRSAAIAAVVLLLPMVMAAQVWPTLGRQAKRMVEVLVALILSKFVIAAVLLLGASAITNHGGVSGLLLGSTLILLAAFSPFVFLRLIPLAEGVLATGLEGQRQRASRQVTQTARLAGKAASLATAGSAAPLEQLVTRASSGPLPKAPTATPGGTASAEDLGGLVGVDPPPPRPPFAPIPGRGLPRIRHYVDRDAYGPVIKFREEEET